MCKLEADGGHLRPAVGDPHPTSRAGMGYGPAPSRGYLGEGQGPRVLLLAPRRHPPLPSARCAPRAGTGKSGFSASRCQDTLAFKPEPGPISPWAGEHQPHVIRRWRLFEQKSVTAVTQPMGSCLCAGGLCPHPRRLLEASSVRLRKTTEPRRGEGRRALPPHCQSRVREAGLFCVCSLPTSRLQPRPRWSPR